MKEQCELCLGYSDSTKQPVICTECIDKLASFDIRDSERTYLIQTLKDIQKETDINVVHGICTAALNYCREEEE